MTTISGSTYPGRGVVNANSSLVNLGGLTGDVTEGSPASTATEDPSARSSAVLGMMPYWEPINICVGGTNTIRSYAEQIIPREPREDDDAYNRRIFHATLPPFVQRLASQAAGTILRKGIHLEGGDQDYWLEWSKDVTGDGTPLNEFCRKSLVESLLYGHTSILVDYSGANPARSLREERDRADKPYLASVSAQQVKGWRTAGNRAAGSLEMVRYTETVSVPRGEFGEEVVDQIRVLRAGSWEVWRDSTDSKNAGWSIQAAGKTSIDEIPLVTVYSNRVATLMSKPPLLEVAELNIAYCQRFCDYHHSIHVGSQPILAIKGFDPESDTELGTSVNTAVLLPPDGDIMYCEPTSQGYQAQLECLKTLESQISSLGISTLAKQNITNAAAEAKRLDRIDSDSIMAIISEDLQRAVSDLLRIAGKYAGKEPPEVTIPKDYENRLLDGNQITAMLQLQMQNQISQSTLLRILQEGEVIPPYIEINEEILKTKDEMEQQFDLQLEQAEAQLKVERENNEGLGGADTGMASEGGTKGSQTLETPMRPGKHAS